MQMRLFSTSCRLLGSRRSDTRAAGTSPCLFAIPFQRLVHRRLLSSPAAEAAMSVRECCMHVFITYVIDGAHPACKHDIHIVYIIPVCTVWPCVRTMF